jgi:NAD(P)-dependent dehydrogenase (short-subunit alcohol dehydrogenase family)
LKRCTSCRRWGARPHRKDVAATVKFALENQSITGTTLLVDGGQHLMRFERDFSLM